MLNQREDMIFYYFRDLYNPSVDVTESEAVPGFTSAGVSAKSPVITLAQPNEPTQIHMSLTNVSGYAIHASLCNSPAGINLRFTRSDLHAFLGRPKYRNGRQLLLRHITASTSIVKHTFKHGSGSCTRELSL